MTNKINLTVMVLDRDFYARQALNSYLAWDRRTRVIARAGDVAGALEYIRGAALAEQPDVLVMEAEATREAEGLREAILRLRGAVKPLTVLCLAHTADMQRTRAAYEAGAKGYLLRNEVRLLLAEAIVYALSQRFVITASIQAAAHDAHETWLGNAQLLLREREYPEMTERIKQALWLCVVEGMPAQLAADEMGISPHTIRSYIKEGYRILESHDDSEFSDEFSPVERAFMRFTALNQPDIPDPDDKTDRPRDKAARRQKTGDE
jgi:DNA-binding NarL/FixJ family response regulator